MLNRLPASRRAVLFTLAGAAGSAAVVGADPGHLATRLWLLSLHDWALPRYRRLVEAVRALLQAVSIQEASEAIEASQLRWIETLQIWRQLEALQLGPTLDRRSSRRLDFWPTRPASIEQAIRATAQLPVSGPESERALSRLGVAVRGLPALEWLLFAEPGAAVPLTRSAMHQLYAVRLVKEVQAEASALHEAWAAESGRWERAAESALQNGVHEALNLLVGSCELLRGKKLQKAARIVALGGRETGLLNAFDSVRSGQTRAFFLLHLKALMQVLAGQTFSDVHGGPAPTIGLTGLLERRGLEHLAAPLLPVLRDVWVAAESLPVDPAGWVPMRVEPIARRLRDLRALIDPPIARALNVVITFTDADGD